MRGLGVHVCESCGKVHDTIGAYQACCDPTPTTSAERDDDIAFANADEAVAYLGSEWVKAQAERVAALEAVAAAARANDRHSWWDGCDDDGNAITVCPCEGSPPCRVRAALRAALAALDRRDGAGFGHSSAPPDGGG